MISPLPGKHSRPPIRVRFLRLGGVAALSLAAPAHLGAQPAPTDWAISIDAAAVTMTQRSYTVTVTYGSPKMAMPMAQIMMVAQPVAQPGPQVTLSSLNARIISVGAPCGSTRCALPYERMGNELRFSVVLGPPTQGPFILSANLVGGGVTRSTRVFGLILPLAAAQPSPSPTAKPTKQITLPVPIVPSPVTSPTDTPLPPPALPSLQISIDPTDSDPPHAMYQVRITNSGIGPADATAVTIQAPGATLLSVSPPCGGLHCRLPTIAPGTETAFAIQLNPPAAGEYQVVVTAKARRELLVEETITGDVPPNTWRWYAVAAICLVVMAIPLIGLHLHHAAQRRRWLPGFEAWGRIGSWTPARPPAFAWPPLTVTARLGPAATSAPIHVRIAGVGDTHG